MADFSHLSEHATAQMVDIEHKIPTSRIAVAEGVVTVNAQVGSLFTDDILREIFSVARIAGIQGIKQTAALIPMCHSVALESVDININFDFKLNQFQFRIISKAVGKTGVEMECLIGASIVGATIYDMIKAKAPGAELGPYRVVRKEGGKLGIWLNPSSK